MSLPSRVMIKISDGMCELLFSTWASTLLTQHFVSSIVHLSNFPHCHIVSLPLFPRLCLNSYVQQS
jgi:hypothetical protein